MFGFHFGFWDAHVCSRHAAFSHIDSLDGISPVKGSAVKCVFLPCRFTETEYDRKMNGRLFFRKLRSFGLTALAYVTVLPCSCSTEQPTAKLLWLVSPHCFPHATKLHNFDVNS
jgi:hypothetical protein